MAFLLTEQFAEARMTARSRSHPPATLVVPETSAMGVTAQTVKAGAVAGIRVIDAATLFAGPLIATVLGDFGAEVIKIEQPRVGDPARTHGPSKDGQGLWWKMLGRNKSTATIYLGHPDGRDLLLRLIDGADVFIENFRPGTLERWGLGPEVLLARNPRLVVVRVTGFGQSGPYARRPAFGTLAEAMSGFAAMTGEPGGPPTLPPFGLADGITALTGVGATLMALWHRDVVSGAGQVVDLAIFEPILTVLGAQPTVYDQLGITPSRTGNRSTNNSPRNTYRTRDGRWVAVSASATPVAARIMRLIGHPEVVDEPWFATSQGRAAHDDVLDGYVDEWVGSRDAAEVIDEFESAEAAVAPIYTVADVMTDPGYVAREAIVSVDDPVLGAIKMQNVLFRLSDAPGCIRWPGRGLGENNREILQDLLGVTQEDLERLTAEGVV